MALPCICSQCAIYLTLQSRRDEHCLVMEKAGCPEGECESCRLACDQFTKKIPLRETPRLIDALPS